MKKILLGTTAIASVLAFSAPSFAADKIVVGISGINREYIGNIDHAEATDTFVDLAMRSNTEIRFKGNTTLDNGINVAIVMEVQADGGDATNMDESYMTLSSDQFGALSVGAHSHRIDGFATRAPVVGSFDVDDASGWSGSFTASANQITDFGDKTVKAGYVSPSLSGFTLFASYTLGEGFGNASNGRKILRSATEDSAGMGIAYEGEFQGASVNADLSSWSDNANNKDEVRGGLAFSVDGLSLGGGYATFDDSSTGRAQDGTAFELGVAYAAGAYEVGMTYMSSESRGTALAGNNDDVTYIIGATYDLGAGVSLTASYFNATADAEGVGIDEASGLIGGIEVSF